MEPSYKKASTERSVFYLIRLHYVRESFIEEISSMGGNEAITGDNSKDRKGNIQIDFLPRAKSAYLIVVHSGKSFDLARNV
jgi:hypothetical protein